MSIDECQQRAILYLSGTPVLFQVILDRVSAFGGGYDWNITDDMFNTVKDAFTAAAIKHFQANKYMTRQVIEDFLNRKSLKKLIILQREIIRMRGGRGDFSIFALSRDDVHRLVYMQKQSRSACKMIGMASSLDSQLFKVEVFRLIPSALQHASNNWMPKISHLCTSANPF